MPRGERAGARGWAHGLRFPPRHHHAAQRAFSNPLRSLLTLYGPLLGGQAVPAAARLGARKLGAISDRTWVSFWRGAEWRASNAALSAARLKVRVPGTRPGSPLR